MRRTLDHLMRPRQWSDPAKGCSATKSADAHLHCYLPPTNLRQLSKSSAETPGQSVHGWNSSGSRNCGNKKTCLTCTGQDYKTGRPALMHLHQLKLHVNALTSTTRTFVSGNKEVVGNGSKHDRVDQGLNNNLPNVSFDCSQYKYLSWKICQLKLGTKAQMFPLGREQSLKRYTEQGLTECNHMD
jgi:hypothetical protein